MDADSFRKLALRKTLLLEDCQERLSAFCCRQVCLAIRCDAGEVWQCNLGTLRTLLFTANFPCGPSRFSL